MIKYTYSFKVAISLDNDQEALNDVLVRLPIQLTVLWDNDDTESAVVATALAYDVLIKQGLDKDIADAVEIVPEMDQKWIL